MSNTMLNTTTMSIFKIYILWFATLHLTITRITFTSIHNDKLALARRHL